MLFQKITRNHIRTLAVVGFDALYLLTLKVLVIVSVLVSVKTALVGPVACPGLLIVSLALQITPTVSHAPLHPRPP
ncbi:hypothetical protein [Sulfitobacter marinus]|uniref:hypothetical protein n=1 Tax=Sulfitobacter marinus TaxID=394264 RepID=UPI001C31B1EC|nr:hypothetical protein [Sulfitobacter marinus]